MSSNSAITVESAIVHIADRNEPAAVCSEMELDLSANPELRDYFTEQVQNAIDDDTNAAKFAASGSQAAKNACAAILADPANLVKSSKDLAVLLHAAMKTHGRIAAGSLAVCVYRQGNAGPRNLALMKLDPGRAFVLKVGEVKGKRLVTFDVQTDVMPTARERIHKAALLPPSGTKRYDLLLLDHQTQDAAALWWTAAFLNAVLVVDGRIGATEFSRANSRASSELAKQGKLAEADAVMQQSRIALRQDRIARSTYVRSLPEAARDAVDTELDKKLAGTRSIPIDVEYAAERLIKKTRFVGRYGFVLEFESAHETDIIKGRTPFQAVDGTPMTRFVLEVPEVQWVK